MENNRSGLPTCHWIFSERTFLFTCSICSFLGAITTIVLIYLPVNSSIAITNAAAIHDPVYSFYSVIYLLHPFVNFVSVLGLAFLKYHQVRSWAILGLIFFFFWAFTEALQQCLAIVANDLTWRKQYLTTQDPALRSMLEVNVKLFSAIYDGLFLLLLIGFFTGSFIYGLMFINRNPFELTLGIMFLIVSFVTLGGIADYTGIKIDFLGWSYKYVQPVLRMLIGVWIMVYCRKVLVEYSISQ